MTIKNWLKKAEELLSLESGTARLDAEVLLANVLDKGRAWLHAHSEQIIGDEKLKLLNSFLKRRALHEPIAYILEKTEFYGRDFYIINGVLVPRPESETMIELCKEYCFEKKLADTYLVDVGTGSGALIITAVLETKINNALAIDIDETCLKVAKINIDKYGLNTQLKKGDLLDPIYKEKLADKHLIILANLPYVPEKYSINAEAKKEPSHAIFGGQDGLDLYRRMYNQLDDIAAKSITVLTESLPTQHAGLTQIATQHNFEEEKEDDFIQVFKR